jgi:hypothetical protein
MAEILYQEDKTILNKYYYLEFLATVHQEKDLWPLTVEEVAKPRFPSITVKHGRFYTPI